ncbi:hypothetical protein BSNK01_08140 [Bacillaceae bacterium]
MFNHIPGYGVITGREILRIAENLLGTRVRVTSVGRTALFVAGWFNPFLREVREMLYLTEDPVVPDGAKYEREIGALPRTPYEEGIAETIRHLQQKG